MLQYDAFLLTLIYLLPFFNIETCEHLQFLEHVKS